MSAKTEYLKLLSEFKDSVNDHMNFVLSFAALSEKPAVCRNLQAAKAKTEEILAQFTKIETLATEFERRVSQTDLNNITAQDVRAAIEARDKMQEFFEKAEQLKQEFTDMLTENKDASVV